MPMMSAPPEQPKPASESQSKSEATVTESQQSSSHQAPPPKQDLKKPKVKQQQSPIPQQSSESSEPQGIIVQLDTVFGLPKEIRGVKIVYSPFMKIKQIGETGIIEGINTEADYYDRRLNKAVVDRREFLQDIPQSVDTRLVIELQTPDPDQPSGYTGIGWTWVQLHERSSNLAALSIGKWRLPVYAGVTRPELMVPPAPGKPKNEIKSNTNVAVCLRIGEPNDAILRAKTSHMNRIEEYVVPSYHDGGQSAQQVYKQQQKVLEQVESKPRVENKPAERSPPPQQKEPEKKPEEVKPKPEERKKPQGQ